MSNKVSSKDTTPGLSAATVERGTRFNGVVRVGVYGTLKQGHGNHRLLQHVRREAVGHVSGHRLFQAGIPFLVADESSEYDVLVELYDVDSDTLASLDRLEGHPSFYCRKELSVHLEDGTETVAWIYEHPPVGDRYTENTAGVF